jgi:hypothetical protein
MTIQVINTGTGPNSGNGDSIRTAFSKVNANFAELATIATGTNFDLLAISSSLVPDNDQARNLGSSSKQWDRLYVGPDGVTINGNALTINGSGNITINGTPFQSGFASTSSLINGSARVRLDAQGSLNFPPNGVLQSYISSSTTATIFLIDDIMLDSPVMIHTIGPHTLSNSDLVKLTGIGTTVELNNKYHYVSVVNTTTVDLYEDAALSIPVDGTGYTPFLGLSNSETFTNTGTTGRSNIISQFLDVYPDVVNVRVNWYASGSGIDQPDPDNTTYTVIKQPGFLAYLVDGVVNKPLYLQRGNTYYLDVFAPPHPVYIQTTGAGYNPADVYSLGVTNQGTGEGIITFTVPLNAPDTLYYQCQHHAEQVGPIYISDGVGKSKVLAVNTQTTSSRVLYQFILENTWPLVNQASYAFTGTFEGGGQLEFQDVEARLTVKSNEQEWIFNPTGVLTLPPEGDIQRNGLSVLSGLKGRTFVVTEDGPGEHYVFDGTPSSPDIVLIRGLTYYFEANVPGHPFWIQSTPGAFDINSVLTDGIINNGVEVGTLTFTVPEDAPDILYYACEYDSIDTGQFLIRNLGNELDLTQVHTDVTPDEQYTHDLGSTSSHWRNIYARTGFFGVIPSWIAVNPLSVFTADVDGYTQIAIQNRNSGTYSSSDFVATADNGSDSDHYIDLGIASSTYNYPGFEGIQPNDGYLFVNSGNLVLFSVGETKKVKILVGDGLPENLVATFDAPGTESTSTTTGALTVVGGIGVAGDIVSHNLMPAADLTYDLGSTSSQWRSIYVGTGTIYIGGVALGVSENNYVTVNGNPIITVSTSGTLTVQGNTDLVLGSVNISDTAPDATTPGSQWFNTVDGRTYVSYNGQWIDTSPVVVPPASTYLGSITVDDRTLNINGSTLTIEDGTLLVNGEQITNDTYIPTNPGDWLSGPIVGTVIDGLDELASRMVLVEASTATITGGTANGWQLTSSTAVVSLSSNGELTLPNGGIIFDNDGPGGGWLSISPANAGLGQALVIYPTQQDGNHVHLTSDGNDTDLYLGNDDQYVKVDHSGTVVVGTYSTDTTSTWTFGTDGPFSTLTLPEYGIIQVVGNNAWAELRWVPTGGYTGSTSTGIVADSTGVTILTDAPSNENEWTFGTDGVLTLPANAPVIKGGGTGTDVTVIATTGTNTATWVFGATGELTLPQGSTISETTGSGVVISAKIIGVPTGIANLNNQGGWNQGSYINTATTGGSGTGLTVDVAGGGGYIALGNITINNSGTGYTVGDVITINNENDLPATFVISTVTNSSNNWTFATDGGLTFPDSTVQTTAWTGILPNPTYSGSDEIGVATPAPLNLNNSAAGTLLTQLNLINTGGQAGAGSAIDFWTYTSINDVPEVRLQVVDDGDYSADFAIKIKANGNDGEGNLTTSWTFGADGVLTLPNGAIISEDLGAIRLEPANASSSTQALLIYPTIADGNHIHLTAGGGDTDLYLGNDDYYVKVDHSGDIVVGTYSTATTTSTWTFGTDGSLASNEFKIKTPNGIPTSIGATSNDTQFWDYNYGSNLATTGGTGAGLTVNVGDGGNGYASISINTPGTGYTAGDVITVTNGPLNEAPVASTVTFIINVSGTNSWTFGADGGLTFPDSTVQTTAYTGGVSSVSTSTLVNGTFTVSLSTIGSLTFPDDTSQTTAYPGVLVPANGDNVSGVANLVFYAGDWYNTSKVGINPANGFLTLSGTGGSGGIILPNSGTIDVGLQLGAILGLTRKIYSEYLGGYALPNPTYSELATAIAGWTADATATVTPIYWTGIPEQTWELTGYFRAPEDGTYTFNVSADDYYFIVIDGDISPVPEINTQVVVVLTRGQVVSYKVLYANVAGSGTLDLQWKNNASQQSFTNNFTGLVTTDIRGTVDLTMDNSKWIFGTDGTTTVPSVAWNYVPTTFTAIPVTYGATQLTFTVLPDNTFVNMSVAVGAGGYGPDSYNLTIPGTTFPGGTTPANDIVFNVTTFESAGPVFSTDPTSVVTYVSGTPPSRYDNITSAGSVGIGAGVQHWTFSNTGTLTFPDNTVQTTAYVDNRTSGSWTLATGSNTVSITVPLNGNYQMWVNGNIPNGIVEWNATVNVSNPNVPVIGSQYAWYYAAGNALVLTAIPDQIVGTAGVISTSTGYAGTTSNVFSFGITNNSISTQTVYWGYTTL